ncbi:MAG: hypothetical protein K1X89_06655 [Myxococcaceae bacterium]|nr:hypothetical protein [Myxococcaceae bacterium]
MNGVRSLLPLLLLSMACGPGTGTLSGKLYGPLGAEVVLQVNGGDDLTVKVTQSGSPSPYDVTAFTFAKPLANGLSYAVTLKSQPADQTCVVYAAGTGTVSATSSVRVGCEYTAESVARDADDKKIGTFYDSQSAVVGGADVSIAGHDIYGEGRFVAFVSGAKLVGTSGAHRQVYLRDRFEGTLQLLSKSAAGVEGDGDSWNPAISTDGLSVAFESYATNLVGNDANQVRDVFLFDQHVTPPTLTRISVSDTGGEFAEASLGPSLDGAGAVVVYETGQKNFPGLNGDGRSALVRKDLKANVSTIINKDASGKVVDSTKPMISEDGTRIVFYSYWPLVAGDTNGLWDIFLYDLNVPGLKRLSLTSSGGERDQGTESVSRVVSPAISGNGRVVAFASTATNVVPGDTNGMQDVFVVDTTTGEVTRVSVASDGTQGDTDSPIGQGERVALSYDGNLVAFNSNARTLGVNATTTGLGNAYLHDRRTKKTTPLTNNTKCCSVGPMTMSREGNYVVFGSSADLDPRFPGSGQFVRFTAVGLAFWWQAD